MQDYKLIKLIQVLTSKELTGLERYLTTPLINTNAEVSKLFTQLCKYHPAFDYPKLSKEWLYTKLYGKAPYDDGKMRKLMTQLTQLIEQFLVSKELDASEDVKAKLLARSLAGRQNYDLFLDVVNARLKELEKCVERGRDYFREGFELSELLFYHPESERSSKRNDYFSKTISDLERYFTLVMLQNEANNIVRTRIVRENNHRVYTNTALEVSKLEGFASIPTIHFFHHIVELLKNQVEEDLGQIRESSLETFHLLSRFEQDLAINLLRNYAVPMSNKGSLPHRQFMFDLYKIELEKGLLSNKISSSAFMNISAIGLAVGELEWTHQFINDCSRFLPDDEKQQALNYCKGLWFYHKGLRDNKIDDFYSAIKCFNMIPARMGPNYEARVRPATIRVHFEIFERRKATLDEVLNQVRNFERHLLGSTEYAAKIRDSHLLFLKYFKNLARIYANSEYTEVSFENFINALNNSTEDITYKPWLMEKAKELAAKS